MYNNSFYFFKLISALKQQYYSTKKDKNDI